MTPASEQDFFDVIDGLLGIGQLEAGIVESVVGHALAGDEARSNPYFAVVVGSQRPGAAEPHTFSRVEMRLPLRPQGRQDAMVLLTVADALAVAATAIEAHYGKPDDVVPSDKNAPRRTRGYHYEHRGGQLRFSIDDATSRVLSVAIDRTERR